MHTVAFMPDGQPNAPARRMRYALGALALGAAILAAGARGMLHTHVGCSGPNVDVPGADGGEERDASDEPQDSGADGGSCIPVTIEVSIVGSYQSTWHMPGPEIYGPSVVVRHVV